LTPQVLNPTPPSTSSPTNTHHHTTITNSLNLKQMQNTKQKFNSFLYLNPKTKKKKNKINFFFLAEKGKDCAEADES
jgi:hypothetical protein